MEMRRLRYFVAVAEELNFRRAAERLHVAQPALSRQIQDLEASLQLRLFARDRRQVSLTPDGAILLEKARAIVGQMGDLRATAQRLRGNAPPRLRVGFISLVAYELLPATLRRFRETHPGVEVVISEFLVMEQFEPLHSDRFDVVILRPLAIDMSIVSRVIHRARFIAALHQAHPLCAHPTLRVQDLSNEDFISLPDGPGPSFYAQIMGFCASAGFRPTVVHPVGDSQAMMGMVGAGMGVAIVPESVRRLATAGVEYRCLTDIDQRAEIAIAWRKTDENPAIAQFVLAAEAVLGEQDKTNVWHGATRDAREASRVV